MRFVDDTALGYEVTVEGLLDAGFDAVLVAKDGKVLSPEGPGWGVEISKAWLDKAQYQKSEVD